MRKRILAMVITCCAFALAMGLAACGGSSSGSAASGSSSASSASATSSASTAPSASAGAPAASSGAAASSSAASSTAPAPAQGTPQIAMGELSMIDVHGTDTGVGADVVIQVKNTGNVPLILSNPTIRIANESGTVIVDESGNGIFTGPSYLRVGDIGFIYTSGPLPLPEGYFPGYDYKAQATADLTACKEVYEYPISNLSISDDGRGVPMVSGTVTNDDSETAKLIEVSVMFLDNEGKMLGVASDVVVNLAPGASQNFTVDGYTLPVSCTMAVISNYDAIAVAPKR